MNADIFHVIEALDKAEDGERIQVWDTDAAMRGIFTRKMKERNISRDYDNLICSLELDGSRLVLSFHQQSVENEFCLDPVGHRAIDPQQATQPQELGELLRMVVNQINYAYDVHKWDFSKVNGASIANGGYITDYEFEYDTFI